MLRGSSPGDILVVDDDPSFCAFACALLESSGFTARPTTSGEDALRQLEQEPPNLIVLDVSMPILSGYEVCRAIRERRADLPILFVSGIRTESLDRVAGLGLGADDYLVKPFEPGELLARIRALLRRAAHPEPALATGLSRRESEVLDLLAEGLDQRQIAARLVISPKTVGTHIERILSKLGVHSRAEAVAAAYRLRLVPVPA